MTGFGGASARLRAGGEVRVEAKSVNQRFLDLKVVLPKEYASVDAEVRAAAQQAVARGRLEIYVSRSAAAAERRIELDADLAAVYVDEWRRLQRRLKLAGEVDLSFLKGLPDLYRSKEPPSAEDELPALRKALGAALRALESARTREGKNLERDLRARVDRLETLSRGMAERAAAAAPDARRRLDERIRELVGAAADAGRILQEAALIADRGDVTEEIVRLKSHLGGLRELCASRDPVGKRLEFLLQEVQREVNTVASKSADLRLTQLAVEAKGEVEKIREQVQNVE